MLTPPYRERSLQDVTPLQFFDFSYNLLPSEGSFVSSTLPLLLNPSSEVRMVYKVAKINKVRNDEGPQSATSHPQWKVRRLLIYNGFLGPWRTHIELPFSQE